jgi:predicted dienelactone hydrolase
MHIRSHSYFSSLLITVTTTLLFVLSLTAEACFAQELKNERNIRLPMPTGQYSLGTSIFNLTDATRRDPFAKESGRFREIMVQVWYPARKMRQASTVPYLTPALLSQMKKEQYLDLQSEVMEGWLNLKTHSVLDAPIVTNPRRLPMLVFSHGFGVSRATYTSIIEDLASHGYIVVAIDHPYSGITVLADGRILSFGADDRGGPAVAVERVEAMTQDVRFVLGALLDEKGMAGRFANHLDAERLGIFGHSLGGAAALEVCRSSTRFKACADLDCSAWGRVETEGVDQPYLVMLNQPGEAHRPPPAMRQQRDDEWAAIISKKKTAAVIVKIAGTYHLSFTDIPFIVPRTLLEQNGADIASHRGFEIITRVLDAFFSRYLSDRSSRPLVMVTKSYREVTIKAYN